jgi:uncharacterized protein (DUF2062 family)
MAPRPAPSERKRVEGRRSHTRFERLRRLVRYRLIIPVFRSPHPPEYTARGVANGVFWGVTPFMGFQTLAMLGTWAVLKRGFGKDSSIVQALIWAWVNNPITMVPMYYTFYVFGLWLTGTSGSLGGYSAFVALWESSEREPTFLARVALLAGRVGLAVTVGCVPFALLGSAIAYRWALQVTRARRRRISAR